jgi:hypothetical protein
MNDEMRSVGTQPLRLPLQAAPIERKLSSTPALAAQEGVVPSFNWPGWTEPFRIETLTASI